MAKTSRAWLLFLCITLSSQILFAQQNPASKTPNVAAHKVVRVIDGDTVVLLIGETETTVRLIGVDTPETVHPSKPVEEYGKEASQFLKNLLAGESVYLKYEPGSKTDKYGRTLAYLYRAPDSLFINLEIIRQGYGHAYTVFPFQYIDTFRFAEQEARLKGKGLWTQGGAAKPAVSQPVGADASQKPASDTVYITKSGTKYHRAGCRYLSKSSISAALSTLSSKYDACSVCNPMARQATETIKPSSSSKEKAAPVISSGRCQATTKKGAQCKRNAKAGSLYCWQHGG